MNKQLLALIYGAPGTGKSTLAAAAPGPRLILDCEGASAFYEGNNVVVETPEDVHDSAGEETNYVINHLHTAAPGASVFAEVLRRAVHDGSIRSVIIDSLTQWQAGVIEQEQARHAKNRWDAHKAVNTRTDRLVTLLRNATMPHVATAHPVTHESPVHVFLLCSERRLTDPTEQAPDRLEPALQGKSLITTGAHCDLIGHLCVEGAGDRFLYITASDRRSCKSRAPGLIRTFGDRIPISNPFTEDGGFGMPQIVAAFEAATGNKQEEQ